MTAVTQPVVDSADRLSFTLFLAVALHALLILGVSFKLDKGSQMPTTLEITLATHKAVKAPDRADYLAQFNQEASGTELEARQLATETPSPFADTRIRDVNPSPQTRAITPAERQLQRVTTTARSAHKAQVQLDPNASEQQARQGQLEELPLLSAEIASLQAKLDRQRQAYAKRPRIRTLTSVATKASYDAEYLNRWISKVEFVGNRNYPQQALRERLFGKLRMVTILKPDGSVERVEILESSGHRVLDDAALQIVHLASPFAPFPVEIRKEVDQLEIIRTMHFEISGLTTF